MPQTPGYQNPTIIPPRPAAPKLQPRPEPMDVDSSMRTKAVNYMNKIAQNDQFCGESTPIQSEQFRSHPKLQRNIHLETEGGDNTSEEHCQDQLLKYEDEAKLSILDRTNRTYPRPDLLR